MDPKNDLQRMLADDPRTRHAVLGVTTATAIVRSTSREQAEIDINRVRTDLAGRGCRITRTHFQFATFIEPRHDFIVERYVYAIDYEIRGGLAEGEGNGNDQSDPR